MKCSNDKYKNVMCQDVCQYVFRRNAIFQNAIFWSAIVQNAIF